MGLTLKAKHEKPKHNADALMPSEADQWFTLLQWFSVAVELSNIMLRTSFEPRGVS